MSFFSRLFGKKKEKPVEVVDPNKPIESESYYIERKLMGIGDLIEYMDNDKYNVKKVVYANKNGLLDETNHYQLRTFYEIFDKKTDVLFKIEKFEEARHIEGYTTKSMEDVGPYSYTIMREVTQWHSGRDESALRISLEAIAGSKTETIISHSYKGNPSEVLYNKERQNPEMAKNVYNSLVELREKNPKNLNILLNLLDMVNDPFSSQAALGEQVIKQEEEQKIQKEKDDNAKYEQYREEIEARATALKADYAKIEEERKKEKAAKEQAQKKEKEDAASRISAAIDKASENNQAPKEHTEYVYGKHNHVAKIIEHKLIESESFVVTIDNGAIVSAKNLDGRAYNGKFTRRTEPSGMVPTTVDYALETGHFVNGRRDGVWKTVSYDQHDNVISASGALYEDGKKVDKKRKLKNILKKETEFNPTYYNELGR